MMEDVRQSIVWTHGVDITRVERRDKRRGETLTKAQGKGEEEILVAERRKNDKVAERKEKEDSVGKRERKDRRTVGQKKEVVGDKDGERRT